MAEENENPVEETPPAKKGGMLGSILWAVVGFALGAGGFAVPIVFPGLLGGAASEAEAEPAKPSSPPAFLEFGETVVNLHSDRLNRYLRMNITLQVEKDDEEMAAKLLEERRAILKSWLLSHLSDRSMEDVRGAAGQNRLRREIQNFFNSTLFDDGYDRVHDVLFEEFNVQ